MRPPFPSLPAAVCLDKACVREAGGRLPVVLDSVNGETNNSTQKQVGGRFGMGFSFNHYCYIFIYLFTSYWGLEIRKTTVNR